MSDLAGLRVLLVEDEGGVAMLLEDMLDILGCEVVASVAHLQQAFEAMESKSFDIAILDVNVSGEQVFPLARQLVERGTPIVFSTGYGAAGLPVDLRHHAVLAKPFAFEELRRTLAATVPSADGHR